MSTMSLALEALGWASGALIMISGLPNIIRNFKNSGSAKPSPTRDALQLLGNLGWTIYGIFAGVVPIAVMCGTSAILMTALLTQQALKRRAELRQTRATPKGT